MANVTIKDEQIAQQPYGTDGPAARKPACAEDLTEEWATESIDELTDTIHRLQYEINIRQNIEKDLRHSRESFMLAVQMANLGTFDYYPASGKLLCSDIARNHFGFSPDASPNYNLFLSALHPDDRNRIDQYIANLVSDPESGGTYSAEFRTIGMDDGIERWITSRGEIFYNTSRQAVRFIGVTRDISEEKRSKEMILRLNRMHAVLSATNQAIVHSRDEATIFRKFCHVAIEHGGFKSAFIGLVDSTTGLFTVTASHGDTQYLDDLQISSRLEPDGKRPVSVPVEYMPAYGNSCNDPTSWPWHERALRDGVHASACIPLLRDNNVIGALALYADNKDYFDSHQMELIRQMGTDISFALGVIENEKRRQKAEQALREKEQMLLQQSRHAAMGEMIGNIAHQWRQPLNSLGLTAQQMLLFYDLGEFNREFLVECVEKSMELIQHMSATIDDFRSYFKPNKERTGFCCYDSVIKTLSLMEGNFRAKHIKVTVHAESKPMMYGYPNEFAQVLINILSNASDAFIEHKICQPHIIITVFNDEGKTIVTISDNAGGIPDDIICKIFDPYFTTKGSQSGTGMGLFMSKAIIEKNMAGSLTARNIEGGTEFRIEV